jgi:hypothetical protein
MSNENEMMANIYAFGLEMAELEIVELRAEIGRDLACWCRLCPAHADGKPFSAECPDCTPCHADVLGRLVAGLRCDSLTPSAASSRP